MLPVLSTMWAQQSRFDGNFTAFAEIAKAAGYSGIEVSHSSKSEGLEELIAGGILPVTSLHAPTPYASASRGRYNSWLNLASTDEDERQEAVRFTCTTVDYAERCGARYMVVHLGGIGGRLLEPESRLRRLYGEGRIDSDEARAAQRLAHQQRTEQAAPWLAAARRSLDELVTYAGPRQVAIGLENRLHFHEFPHPDETLDLLSGYPPEVVGYWHDVGHAEVQSRLGLVDARTALSRLTPRLLGTHLHDVRGILDHRAPGNGDVQWDYIAAAVRPETPRTFEIDQREPEPALATAITFLRGRGVIG